jgi:hypothetical protein
VTEAISGDTLETQFLRLESSHGSADVDAKLSALKQQMGLLPPSAPSAETKQLGAGVQDAQVEDVSDEEARSIPEAQLLEEFGRLEKSAET